MSLLAQSSKLHKDTTLESDTIMVSHLLFYLRVESLHTALPISAHALLLHVGAHMLLCSCALVQLKPQYDDAHPEGQWPQDAQSGMPHHHSAACWQCLAPLGIQSFFGYPMQV